MRKLIGYILLGLSCLAFTVLPIIPFLDWQTSRKATWGGAVFIFAEVTWWIAMPLLGKEVLEFCQRYWALAKSWLQPSGDKHLEADKLPISDPSDRV